MSKLLVYTSKLSEAQWLAWRRKGIGGSDAAAICGLNPWKSAMAVYLDKRGERAQEPLGEAAEWGNRLEDVVAQKFKEITGFKLTHRKAIFQHDEYPWMIANVDRFIVDKQGNQGVLEIKTCGLWSADDWGIDEQGNQKAPDQYIIQVQHYLAVTGLSYGYLAVLIGGQEFKHMRVDRDDNLIGDLIEMERKFWEGVEAGVEPSWSHLACDTKILGEMYPQARKDAPVTLPESLVPCFDKYEEAKKHISHWEKIKDENGNKIRAELRDNAHGILGDNQAKWSNRNRTSVDYESMYEDHPELREIIAGYTQTAVSRQLTISKRK